MPYIVADRVAELSTSEGVGAFALLGGVAGFRSFASAMAVADTCPYFIEALDANNVPSGAYEYGRGTYSAANTLTRTTVLGSSNGGAAVNFAAGNKLVSVGVLAADMLAKGDIAALTPFALTLLNDATAAAWRGTLGAGATGDSLFTAATAAEALAFLPIQSGTPVATTSGTSIDLTGIPSWVKRITGSLSGVSSSGTSNYMIQIGDSGGIENNGYLGSTVNAEATGIAGANGTTGFHLTGAVGAASIFHGIFVLTLLNPATNLWAFSVTGGLSNGAVSTIGGGSKALSGTLDRFRLTTVGGADTFDAGSLNFLYE